MCNIIQLAECDIEKNVDHIYYGFSVITNIYDLVFSFAYDTDAKIIVNDSDSYCYDSFTFLYDDLQDAENNCKKFNKLMIDCYG